MTLVTCGNMLPTQFAALWLLLLNGLLIWIMLWIVCISRVMLTPGAGKIATLTSWTWWKWYTCVEYHMYYTNKIIYILGMPQNQSNTTVTLRVCCTTCTHTYTCTWNVACLEISTQVNSEICEQTFSWLSRYAKITRHMNRERFLFFILYICELHNRRYFSFWNLYAYANIIVMHINTHIVHVYVSIGQLLSLKCTRILINNHRF